MKNCFVTKGLESLCLSLLLLGLVPFDSHKVYAIQYFVGGQPATEAEYNASEMVVEGVNLLHANENQQAVDKFAQAVSLAPNMAEAHHDLGLALAKLGRSREALDQLRMAVNLKPELDSAWLTLGGLYQSSGQIDDALQIYREFLKRFPQHPDAAKIANIMHGLAGEERKQQKRDAQIPGNGMGGNNLGANQEAPDYFVDIATPRAFFWPAYKMPLKVYIASGNGTFGYIDDFGNILQQAFSDWSAASAERVRFVYVDSPKHADIECSWTSDSSRFANSAEAGEAHLVSNKDGIVHGTIMLLTVPLMTTLPLTPNRFRVICLHEIGHVLGMAGHTNNPADAMFYSSSLSDQYKTLSQRDANTIIRLYSGLVSN